MEEKVHGYLLSYGRIALENTPKIFAELLEDFPANDPIWDYKPSDDRFSLREAVAHIADWNDIYSERLHATLDSEVPVLPNKDEGKIALERSYATSDPVESLKRFRDTRNELVNLLSSIKPHQWDRMAVREGLGPVRLDQQFLIIVGHDAYHVKQVMEYVDHNR